MQYHYDESGNISEIRENGALVVRYAYDKLSRLVREDNKKLGKTYTFTYDNNGNILAKREYTFTLTEDAYLDAQKDTTVLYAYDGDKLMSYGKETFTYDVMGNPTAYRGKTVKWERGHLLAYFDGHVFSYDGRGRLIEKDTARLLYDGNGNLISYKGMHFLYDSTGVVAVRWNGATYYYRKNVQGDIIALLDSTGAVVVQYIYDAWGNHAVVTAGASTNLGNLNPFRYRGYFYEEDTGLYYLQTRYYDPELGRFISMDDVSYLDPDTINGLNLYAYCGNNPVMCVDPTGHAWWDVLAWIGLGLFVAALTVVTLGAVGVAVGGVVGGIIMGAAIGTLALGTTGAVVGAVGGMIYDAVQGNAFGTSIWTWTKAGFGIGAIAGAVIGGTVGGMAGASLSGMDNLMLWSGLGKDGATIAAQEAGKLGLKTIGQTFGGKVISIFPKAIAEKMWIWASKLAVSTVSMEKIFVLCGSIAANSIFSLYELPILLQRAIEVIQIIFGG